MTLGVNSSSSIPDSPKSCNSRFLNHLSTIGAAVVGLFLTSNPIRADVSAVDLSNRTVVPRTQEIRENLRVEANAIPEVSADEENDSDDDEMDVDGVPSDDEFELCDDEIDVARSSSYGIDEELEELALIDVELGWAHVEKVKPSSDLRYLNSGLIYQIHDPNTGASSYLIGTFHPAGKAAAKNPFIPDIIERCDALYTEIGNLRASEQNCPPELWSLLSYDDVLVAIANSKKKLVLALDSESGLDLRNKNGAMDADELWESIGVPKNATAEGEKIDKHNLLKILDTESSDNILGWEKGDAGMIAADREAILERSPLVYARFCTEREHMWLTKLRGALQSGQPICIAVGATHLVGKDGLVAELQKMGLIVEQSSFSACAR